MKKISMLALALFAFSACGDDDSTADMAGDCAKECASAAAECAKQCVTGSGSDCKNACTKTDDDCKASCEDVGQK